MNSSRTLSILALTLALGPLGLEAGEAQAPPETRPAPEERPAPAVTSPDDAWYGQNLERAVTEYGGVRNVPKASIRWIADTFDRPYAQVLADMGRQPGALTEVEVARPPEPAAEIPQDAWKDEPDLDPAYARMLESVVEKYDGATLVPGSSVSWLSRRWEREERQVRRDLARVQATPPEVLSDAGYAY